MDSRRTPCSICSQLKDYERGFQKSGEGTFLPPAADKLTVVRDLKPTSMTLGELRIPSSRLLQLKRCPECSTSYLYRTDYEFIYGGTEDEQHLERLTAEQAAACQRMQVETPAAPPAPPVKESSFYALIENFGVPRLVIPNTTSVLVNDRRGGFVRYDSIPTTVIKERAVHYLRVRQGEGEFGLLRAHVEMPLAEALKEVRTTLDGRPSPLVEFRRHGKNRARLTLTPDFRPAGREEIGKAVADRRVVEINSWRDMGDGYTSCRLLPPGSLPDDGYCFVFDPPCSLSESDLPPSPYFDSYDTADQFFDSVSHYFTRNGPAGLCRFCEKKSVGRIEFPVRQGALVFKKPGAEAHLGRCAICDTGYLAWRDTRKDRRAYCPITPEEFARLETKAQAGPLGESEILDLLRSREAFVRTPLQGGWDPGAVVIDP